MSNAATELDRAAMMAALGANTREEAAAIARETIVGAATNLEHAHPQQWSPAWVARLRAAADLLAELDAAVDDLNETLDEGICTVADHTPPLKRSRPMAEYRRYRRSQIAEIADWHPGFDMAGVSVSEAARLEGAFDAGAEWQRTGRVLTRDQALAIVYDRREPASVDAGERAQTGEDDG